MAGIGFEIRRILQKETLLSILQAYTYAGIIGSGPWVLSVIGVMLIGVLSLGHVYPSSLIVQFLVSVTWLMAASLILTGLLQLLFTRYVADRLFEKKDRIILPNLMGVLWVTIVAAGVLGAAVLYFLFQEPLLYELMMLANFVLLCGMWMVVIFLSSMKQYRQILLVFLAGYSLAVVSALALRPFGLVGLLGGVLIGHGVLFFSFLFMIIRAYPGRKFVDFDFTDRRKIFISLAFAGFFFNLAVWVDKFIVWFTPELSQQIIGPLRASPIYDLPIFLAYLSIIPGMAVFLVRMETDFAEHYDRFYNAVREGETLEHIYFFKDQMVYTARQGIYEIFKVQGLTIVILLLWGPEILELVGISPLYLRLFYIDIVGVGLQVLLLAILNVAFYLDYRNIAVGLSGLFLVSNAALTWLTIQLGPAWLGYGFTIAMALTVVVGLWVLSTKLDRLEYETFMLQE